MVSLFNERKTLDPHLAEEYFNTINGSEAVAEGRL